MTHTAGDPIEPNADAAGPGSPSAPSHEVRGQSFSFAWRCVFLVLGSAQLVFSRAKFSRGAWLPGALEVVIGIGGLFLAVLPWSRLRVRVRPVSVRKRRIAAWMHAHPVQLAIAWGLTAGLMGGALFGLEVDRVNWALCMALWLLGGLLSGMIFVRVRERRFPPTYGTAVGGPLSPP